MGGPSTHIHANTDTHTHARTLAPKRAFIRRLHPCSLGWLAGGRPEQARSCRRGLPGEVFQAGGWGHGWRPCWFKIRQRATIIRSFFFRSSSFGSPLAGSGWSLARRWLGADKCCMSHLLFRMISLRGLSTVHARKRGKRGRPGGDDLGCIVPLWKWSDSDCTHIPNQRARIVLLHRTASWHCFPEFFATKL